MKKLSEILPSDYLDITGDTSITVNGIAFDSREIKPGFLFVAMPGSQVNGSTFIPQAISAGAAALVTEDEVHGHKIPIIRVANSRKALSIIARNFYDNPSAKLSVFAVTGTKGKTTVTYLIQSILRKTYGKAFRFGTVEYDLGFETRPARNTTPESLQIVSLLTEASAYGANCGVLEVSSHALKTYRVEDLTFAAACFTNLSLEHTEFHPDMEDYYQAKKRLFFELLSPEKPRILVIDDEYGQRLADECRKAKLNCRTVSLNDRTADYFPLEIKTARNYSTFMLSAEGKEIPCDLKLSGNFNVVNAMTAFAACSQNGIDSKHIISGLSDVTNVPGRFETVENSKGLTVIVDYAHAPAALENVLKAARALTEGRLITVFGCGGDRCPDKRPVMGRIAAELSDVTIVTSDNPRSEKPEAITAAILAGTRKVPSSSRSEVFEEVDRRRAIEMAINMAEKNDVVIIAGKGHETGQRFSDRVIPFDDRKVAKEILEQKNK